MGEYPTALEMANLKRRPRGLPPNAMKEQTEVTHQKLFYPMGESLLFQTNDQLLLKAAEEALGAFPPDALQPWQAPLVLQIFLHDVKPRGAPPPAGRPPNPLYRTHGHLLYVSLGAGTRLQWIY